MLTDQRTELLLLISKAPGLYPTIVRTFYKRILATRARAPIEIHKISPLAVIFSAPELELEVLLAEALAPSVELVREALPEAEPAASPVAVEVLEAVEDEELLEAESFRPVKE